MPAPEPHAHCTEHRCGQGTLHTANFLFPKARVMSGGKALVEWACTNATKRGATYARVLAVHGAFHSP